MSKARRWWTFASIALAAGSIFVLGSGTSRADDDEATTQAEDAMKHDDAIRNEPSTSVDTMPQGVEEPSTPDPEDK